MRKFTILILLTAALVGCGSAPKSGGRSGSEQTNIAFPYGTYFKGGQCQALGNWAIKLKNKYPNWVFDRSKKSSYREYQDKVPYLFEDDIFIPTFGVRYEDLSVSQAKEIADIFNPFRKACKRTQTPEVQYLLNLDVLARYFDKNTEERGNWRYARESYWGLVAERAAARQYAGILEENRSVIDLSGRWSGSAKCGKYTESAELIIDKSEEQTQEGRLTVSLSSNYLKNLPVYFEYIPAAKGKFSSSDVNPAFTVYALSESGVYKPQQGKTRVFTRDDGVRHMKMQVPTCNNFALAKIPSIPQIKHYDSFADRCYGVLTWLGRSHRTTRTLKDILYDYPNVVSRLDLHKAYYHTVFSDDYKHYYGGTKISELSDVSLERLLKSVEWCQEFSGRRKQILNDLGEDFWPFIDDVKTARTYNQEAFDASLRMEEIIKDAANTDDSMETVPKLREMVKEFSSLIVINPQREYLQIYAALAERANAAVLMKRFAEQNGLTELPLLPTAQESAKVIRPDDERFKRGTDADVEELEKPIIINL